MAIAECKISFEIDYTSSVPVTNTAATVSYGIQGSGNSTVINNVDPDSVVALPVIPTPGDYNLMVKLSAGGVDAANTSSFTIGNCSSCEKPKINSVQIQNNGQIVMNYLVDPINLATPEYQIATDPDFNDIIQLKIDFNYTQIENVFMNNGNFTFSKDLYIRARKHCFDKSTGASVVSGWSNVVTFKSGRWILQKAPYAFDAYCVSGKFEDPITTDAKICFGGNTLLKTIHLDTVTPQVGSFIYLIDGNTPALPPNLNSFDTGGASSGFNEYGIKWIRFANDNGYTIYNVEKNGQIIGISQYNCTA
ncbi:hypothetical protein ASG22_16020 [Chryseobacterium sp. Leaf405]|uniref:hypothetical protein n=1 Tax=Chryseobacterium sp. Leaf405 TaxID=1736367 RepID=UPI0006F63B36|nr:hypothetical protein [Chryseobacterium sp. Leaf405]KQT20924.1 hypothetical protein ASG22_16020 [Chryseobacterium sp. Leaf405]